MHNLNSLNLETRQIINIGLAESQISVSHTSEPDFEALVFSNEFLSGQFHFNFIREKPITS